MELLTILLSGLLGIFSPVGTVADSVAENAIRDRLYAAEQLAVRIDNRPTHQLLNGRVDKVRFAGRGLFPEEGIRIALLDIETDGIAIDAQRIRRGHIKLEKPLYAGVHLVVTQADINQALKSKAIADQLKTLSISAIGNSAQLLDRYDFVNPRIEFLNQNRLRFNVTLKPQSAATPPDLVAQPTEPEPAEPETTDLPADQLRLTVESGLVLVNGQTIEFIDPSIRVNNQALPSEIVTLLTQGISQRFDLKNFENKGITAHVLNLETSQQQLDITALVRLDPQLTQR